LVAVSGLYGFICRNNGLEGTKGRLEKYSNINSAKKQYLPYYRFNPEALI